jgi:ubiquinone/menaquinone biosynthesis C-methylase UbiE
MNRVRSNATEDRASCWQRVVSLCFRLLYQELAHFYDIVAWLVSFGQWKAWGETVIPHIVGERVLELGHGPGHLLIALAERGFFSVGLDASDQMVRMAHRRLRRSGHEPTVLLGRAQAPPFPSESFDSVIASFPTAYIADPITLAEIARVLTLRGRLIVVLGARLTGRDPLSRFVEWLYSITGQRESPEADSWPKVFRAAGLTTRWQQVEMRRSEVYLLFADRVTLGDID